MHLMHLMHPMHPVYPVHRWRKSPLTCKIIVNDRFKSCDNPRQINSKINRKIPQITPQKNPNSKVKDNDDDGKGFDK